MHDSVTVLLPRIFVLSTAPFVPFYSRQQSILDHNAKVAKKGRSIENARQVRLKTQWFAAATRRELATEEPAAPRHTNLGRAACWLMTDPVVGMSSVH